MAEGRGRKVRRRIAGAAADAISECGLGGASMREVAERSGWPVWPSDLRMEAEVTAGKLPVPSPIPVRDAVTMVAALVYGLGLMHLVDGRDPVPPLRARP